MKKYILFISSIIFLSCIQEKPFSENKNPTIEEYYKINKGNSKPSISKGKVEKGSLKNGKLIPFNGKNYRYFDTSSYLGGRAFLNDKVLKTTLETYKKLETLHPKRKFCTMECSHKHGGKLFPHKTHQNGLSVDFMMPLLKNKKAYYNLDNLGIAHYWLEFDENGKYSEDKSISIDFNLIAEHILILDKIARKNGLKINKVIIKIELKDELFATKFGKRLKKSGIYVVKSLTPLINSLHDEHYHVDFESI